MPLCRPPTGCVLFAPDDCPEAPAVDPRPDPQDLSGDDIGDVWSEQALFRVIASLIPGARAVLSRITDLGGTTSFDERRASSMSCSCLSSPTWAWPMTRRWRPQGASRYCWTRSTGRWDGAGPAARPKPTDLAHARPTGQPVLAPAHTEVPDAVQLSVPAGRARAVPTQKALPRTSPPVPRRIPSSHRTSEQTARCTKPCRVIQLYRLRIRTSPSASGSRSVSRLASNCGVAELSPDARLRSPPLGIFLGPLQRQRQHREGRQGPRPLYLPPPPWLFGCCLVSQTPQHRESTFTEFHHAGNTKVHYNHQ